MSKWVNINESGLPAEAVETAARCGELVASKVGDALIVERKELNRWLETKRVPADKSALARAKQSHIELIGPPTRKAYRAAWVETPDGGGYYTALITLPDGSTGRYDLKDQYGCPFYTDKSDYASAEDAAYEAARRILTDAAVDTELAEQASAWAESSALKKGRPISVKQKWLPNLDGSGGEWSAKLGFRNGTSFLVPLHNSESKPRFISRKLSKQDKAALQSALVEIAQTDWDH